MDALVDRIAFGSSPNLEPDHHGATVSVVAPQSGLRDSGKSLDGICPFLFLS